MQLADPNVNLTIILPEIIIAVVGIVVMLYDCFFPKNRVLTGAVSLIGIGLAGAALAWIWSGTGNVPLTAWGGMVTHDNLRLGFTTVFLVVSALTILISTVWVEQEEVAAGEFHALLLFATFGMMLMAVGNDMVVIFLGLETLSIATYVMAGLRKGDLRSNESAMKYFVLGSLASAFLLYGIALIYGATGSTNITEIAARIADPNFPALLLVGGAMLIVGFGFKIAAVPFHVWTPDVYEGAPATITGFMATGPKAAAFASFTRVFVIGFPFIAGAEAAGYLHQAWISVLAVIAILTMTVGNVAAIMQNNVKRMLAFSSISHAGYTLVGLIGAGFAATTAARDEAVAAVAFYMLTYAVTTLGAFAIITLLAQRNDRRAEFNDFNGIGTHSPVLAFTMALFMLSLLGMPLTAGFIGKVLVFRPALEAGNTLLTVVVVAAVINTAISAYYYLRLIVVMFFKERTTSWTAPQIPAAVTAAIIITVLGVFYLGIFGNGLIEKFSRSVTVAEAQVK
ncbi:MAG: NADH-quinone oxidoreductase subunit N [Acidobacteria bacterium]|nr:NADH-quinone oxidoreductase subunit N [Acidobacteriota bacterium]